MGDEMDGWSSAGEKYVCPKCLEDDALQDLVRAQAEVRRCDYCGRRGRSGNLIAAPVDAVIERVYRGLQREWTDPVNELPYDQGYVGRVLETSDVLYQVGPITSNEDLLADITECLGDSQWCEVDYFAVRRDEALTSSWRQFKFITKHRQRYFFLHPPDDDEDTYYGAGEIPPSQSLGAIASVVTEADLVTKIPAGTPYFRGRVHKPAVKLKTAEQLGTPTTDFARFPNRMSPAGIPMFYGAEDRKTAIAEISDPSRTEPATLTTGAFRSSREFYLLDLAQPFSVPSLFNLERAHLRDSLSFLHDFAKDLSAPIIKDGREHIEYVPTQIVTEFFRHQYRWLERHRLDGIRYRSAQAKGGVCVVLFVESEGCGDPGNGVESLVLDYASVRRKRLNW